MSRRVFEPSRRVSLKRIVSGLFVWSLSPILFSKKAWQAHASAWSLGKQNGVAELAGSAAGDPEPIYDCLILGGGLAGMAAANALAYPRVVKSAINNKPRSVLVLEGQGRLGGRLFTKNVPGIPGSIELGAQYIHVDDEKNYKGRRQSLWQAVDEYKIQVTPIHRLFCGVAFSKTFSKVRRHWQIIFELPLLWLFTFRSKISGYRGPDMSLRQWLNQPLYDEKERPVADIYLSGPVSGRLEEISLNGFNQDRFESLDSGNYEYKVKPGWDFLIEQLRFRLPGFVSNPHFQGGIPIKYHSRVTRIRYGGQGVEVTVEETQNGRPGSDWQEAIPIKRIYRARTAILTFPIGILRRAAGIDSTGVSGGALAGTSPAVPVEIEFSPRLPESKTRALRAIGVGVAAKLFIVFDARFWNAEIGLINRVDGLSTMGRTYFVPNYGGGEDNVVLGAYLGGAEALKVVEWSDEEVLRQVCEELGSIFIGAHRERPIFERVKKDPEGKAVYFFKNWARDPWSYGNDSYLVYSESDPLISQALPTARRELASAAETPGLYWAGEATVYEDNNQDIYASAHAGVSHGAHASGLRAAKEVADFLDCG